MIQDRRPLDSRWAAGCGSATTRAAFAGVCATALALGAGLSVARAQTTSSSPPAPAQSAQVQEVIVTAERRAEPLEKVPLAVSAVSGKEIENSTFENLGDIQSLVPSVEFSGGETPQFSIRGVGTATFDYGIESSVGVFLDDVVQASPRSPVINTLTDVDQVQVLRGPQGTLFGKNTSAGAIVITTTPPQLNAFEDIAHVSYGSYNDAVVQDIVNIPVSDTLAVRIAGGYMSRDGFIENVATGHDLYAYNDSSLRAKVLWEPTSKLSVYVIGDYENHWDNGNELWTIRSYGVGDSSVIFVPPTFIKDSLTALGVVAGPNNTRGAWSGPNYLVDHSLNGQVDVTYKFDDGYSFKSVTAFQAFGNHVSIPVGSTLQNFFNTNSGFVDSYQTTQEFRLTSPTTNRFEYVAGLYFFDLINDAGQVQGGTLGLEPNNSPIILSTDDGGDFEYHVDSRSYAAYGQGTYQVTHKLDLIIGGRLTYDDLFSQFRIVPQKNVCQIDYFETELGIAAVPCVPPGVPSPYHELEVRHPDWSGRLGLQYNFTDTIMSYVTVARGYKGPTVSNIEGAATEVYPETSVDYEVGVKSELFDRRLVLNTDLFYDQFQNFQTQVYDTSVTPATYVEGNAGGLYTEGVETDFDAQATPNLAFSGGVSYVNAVFTSFLTECDPDVVCGIPDKSVPGAYQLAGTPLPNSPAWTIVLAGNYEHPVLDDFLFQANVNAVYKSHVIFELNDPNTRQSGYTIVNASVGLGPANGTWKLSVWARNLLNQHYWAGIFPTYFDTHGYSNLPDPSGNSNQTIGVALDMRFR